MQLKPAVCGKGAGKEVSDRMQERPGCRACRHHVIQVNPQDCSVNIVEVLI